MHREKVSYLEGKYGSLEEIGIFPVDYLQVRQALRSISQDQGCPDNYSGALRWLRDRASIVSGLGSQICGQEVGALLEASFSSVCLRRFWVVWDFSEGVDEFPAEIFLAELDQLRNPGAEDIELIEPDARMIVGISHFGELWVYRQGAQ